MTSLLVTVFFVTFVTMITSSEIKSNMKVNDEERGFIVHRHKCGGEFKLEHSAVLEAIDYPDDHQFLKQCIWKVTAQYDDNIALIFRSLNLADNCKTNYLAVRDGDDKDDRLIGIYCGTETPVNLRTTDSGLYVKFVSDGTLKNSSFLATVVRIYDECERRRPYLENPYVLEDGWHPENICGKTFGPTETKGTIKSPCHPGVYPRNKNCIWKILAPSGSRINLKFNKLNLPSNENKNETETCEQASVEISSLKEDEILKNHGKFCGNNLPSTIISEGNALEVVFRSSRFYNHDYSGFTAEFSHEVKN